jgi:anti-sigma factor RsiW
MASDEHPSCEEIRPLVREATRGGLDEATRARIYGHLAGCPTCRSVAEEERGLDRLLEQRLPRYAAPLPLKRRLEGRLAAADEPAPPTPRRAALRPAALRWLAPGLIAAAAAAAVVVLAPRGQGPAPGEPLVAEAVADHLRMVYRDHPVDIESGGPHQVKPWFTGRLDFALPTVFAGNDEFTLEGGAVGVYIDRQAAELVYKRQLHKISLFVYRAEGLSFPKADRPMGRAMASVRQVRGFSVIVWRDGELGYTLVSDLNETDLMRLGAQIAN